MALWNQLRNSAHALRALATSLATASGLATLLLAAGPAQAEGRDCALVALHGKWGAPQQMQALARKLAPACDAQLPEMTWSRRRAYDKSYPEALQEIAAAVHAARAQGYRRVLLVGQSLGANAALAYMAEQGDVDAVVALSPGHNPAAMYEHGISRAAVDQARALVAEGKGQEPLSIDDQNQGRQQSMRMTATVLLSFFDPQGLAHMPASTSRFRNPVPVLWVVGRSDPLFPLGRAWAFDHLPPHPASRYLEVDANHFNAMDVAAEQILAWMGQLP